MEETLNCKPIGYFHCRQSEKYMAPKQSELGQQNGYIELHPDQDFEQALEDLLGFDRIWLIYWFHRNLSWKPKVLTPRGGVKRGVFATRSPHRPNPLGLSCVELIKIDGRKLYVGKNDLLDLTPIFDIKPYLNYADAFPHSKQGWIESDLQPEYKLKWSLLAEDQVAFIEVRTKIDFKNTVELRLTQNPFPFPSHRIKKIEENAYELALKTWRVCYSIDGENVQIHKISSGYDQETLQGSKKSRWSDVPLHKEFLAKYEGSKSPLEINHILD